ncbi:MAG: PD-(D/E)XK nuclease family protein [Actinomycetota bacterium]|nr:PD-(D/E)XK nuclease family protein [Actinomycetota bacterium]
MVLLDPAEESDEIDDGSGLNPAQRDLLAALGARPDERPAFDPRIGPELRAGLEERLGPAVARLPDGETLFISKHAMSSVLGCEGKYLAEEQQGFTWTVPTATGSVAHKAIELSVHWRGDPAPGLLVDEAMAALIDSERNLAPFLGQLSEAERAELRSRATERVTMFAECFPPLEARWRPVTEARLRADLCGDRVALSGKVDLTVGRAEGVRAGKVLLDMKTGRFAGSHQDDLRFYALLETLRLGTPPRALASYYLDAGRLQVELVTENLLVAAAERVIGAANAIVDLRTSEHEPVLKPGPPCNWCPALPTCPTGRTHLDERLDQEGW